MLSSKELHGCLQEKKLIFVAEQIFLPLGRSGEHIMQMHNAH